MAASYGCQLELAVVEPETGQAIFVFHHNQGDPWIAIQGSRSKDRNRRIRQQPEQLGTGILHPRSNLFHHAMDPLTFGIAIIAQSVCLTFQIVLVFNRRNACVDGDFLRRISWDSFNYRISDDHASRSSLVTGDLSGFEPALSGAIGGAQFTSIDTQLHALIVKQMFLFVNAWQQIEQSNSIPVQHSNT